MLVLLGNMLALLPSCRKSRHTDTRAEGQKEKSRAFFVIHISVNLLKIQVCLVIQLSREVRLEEKQFISCILLKQSLHVSWNILVTL